MSETTQPIKGLSVVPRTAADSVFGATHIQASSLPASIMLPKGKSLAQALPNLRTALARARSGGADVLGMIVGDSTTMGDGCGAGSNGFVGARRMSLVQSMVRAVNASYFPCSSDSFLGDQLLTGVTTNQYDPRLVLSGTWAIDSSVAQTIGGFLFKSTSIGSNFAFTPDETFDSFDVYTVSYGGGGSMTVNVDGGASLATITDAGGGLIKTTLSCARTAKVINVVAVGATPVYLAGIVCHDVKRPRLNLLQCGNSGARVVNITPFSELWAARPSMSVFRPDYMEICLNINDERFTPTATDATYEAYLQSLITAAKPTADVVLTFSHYVNPAVVPLELQNSFKSRVRALAEINGLIFIDRSAALGSYDKAFASGFMYDDLHPNAVGSALVAIQGALPFSVT